MSAVTVWKHLAGQVWLETGPVSLAVLMLVGPNTRFAAGLFDAGCEESHAGKCS